MHSMVQLVNENPITGFLKFVRRVHTERGLSARRENPKGDLTALLRLVHAALGSDERMPDNSYLSIRDISERLFRKSTLVNKGIAPVDESRRLTYPITLYRICKVSGEDSAAANSIRLLVNELRRPMSAMDTELRTEFGLPVANTVRSTPRLRKKASSPPADTPASAPVGANASSTAVNGASQGPPPGLITSERTPPPHVPSLSDPSSGAPHGGFGTNSFRPALPHESGASS